MSTTPLSIGDYGDVSYDSLIQADYPIVDNSQLAEIPISGQLSGVPGGGGAGDPLSTAGLYASDGTGSQSISVSGAVNPNPTGNWQTLAASIANLTASGFKAFSTGSPTVSIPRPASPSSSILPSVTSTGIGKVSWLTIAAIGVGIGAVALLIKYA
jgi:hypothetical protein